ncbi:MAG TPA: amino acid adenylation domain-containing protein, partial [Steroidobacteraceae bacterium]|nr:amino acid adenylation domain-containing protein [Steroidobacteraceae bacterium]
TVEGLRGRLPATRAKVVALDAKVKEIAGLTEENLSAIELGLSAQHLVYVIYTSGSTGRPKGTAMPHGSVGNLIEWHRKTFGDWEGRRVLQFAALSFDVAFQEIFSTLCTGGTLVLLEEWIRRDAGALMEFLSSHGIERLFIPPLMLQSLAEHARSASGVPRKLQDVIAGGEPLRITAEVVEFFKRLGGCRLHNHYGPAETHLVTALTLTGEPEHWPPLPAIGPPLANTQIYVLDGQGQPVPIGVVGEIHIGGVSVARGYLRRPALTAQRFVADPFSLDTHARLYRSGDLGRWRADGMLEFLGRNDDQLKIRGFRIELGEIEAQLLCHRQIKEAVVIAREDIPGQKYLVAYVTRRTESDPSAEELRTHLMRVLPEYMVPSAFVALDAMPLSPNGKLDRRALPEPQLAAYVSRQYEAPQGEVEEALARIWQLLLPVERVGRHDNFFELGGHSLLGMKLIAKVADALGVRLTVITMFRHPTIREMATAVEIERVRTHGGPVVSVLEGVSGTHSLEPRKEPRLRFRRVALAFSQLAHWHLYQLGERRSFCVIPCATRLQGRLNIDALRKGIGEIVRRHDALRARIVVCDGIPAQEIHESGNCDLTVNDLTGLSEGFRESEVKRLLDGYISDPIDVKVDPLSRFRLLRLREDDHVLVVEMEHIITDGFSMNVLLHEIFSAYVQAAKGRPISLPPVPVQFTDYAIWQRDTIKSWIEKHGAYWEERLKGCQRLRFPVGEDAYAARVSGWGIIPLRIEATMREELQDWSRQKRTTLVMSIFTAYVGLVLRWCNVPEAVILFRTDGRTNSQLEGAIGYFASALYLRVALLETDSFIDLMKRVTEEYCEAYEHADSSYMEAQDPPPDFIRNPCFNWVPQGPRNVRFELDGIDDALSVSRLPFEPRILENFERDTEPMVALIETDDEIGGGVQFPLDRLSVSTMTRFGRTLMFFIQELVRNPEQRVKDVQLL